MAGFGTRALSVALAIPISKFVTSKLDQSWRAATGTEPPSLLAGKQLKKDNKKAAKLGLAPKPIDDPTFADALMWAGISAMSLVVIKFASERGAEEITKFFSGDNPEVEGHNSLLGSGYTGVRQGIAMNKIIGRND